MTLPIPECVCTCVCVGGLKTNRVPWLVSLSGLGVVLQTEKVASLIPGQGTSLGCRWDMLGRQPIDVSLLHPCFSPSL